jgi:hypothetical protein
VAAGIVALTEKAVPSLEALAGVMSGTGMAKERVGGVLHALRRVRRAARPGAPRRAPPAVATAAANPRSSWWKRLFAI